MVQSHNKGGVQNASSVEKICVISLTRRVVGHISHMQNRYLYRANFHILIWVTCSCAQLCFFAVDCEETTAGNLLTPLNNLSHPFMFNRVNDLE